MAGTAAARAITNADEQIAAAIGARRSFLLDAGAGSGKTSSLVRALTLLRTRYRRQLLTKHQQVACITYTNVAKDEIIERTERDDLFRVSTIHDFLWDQIKPHQRELRQALLQHNTDLPATSRRRVAAADLEASLNNVPIVSYSDRGAKFVEGRIHHDDVIAMAAIMFEHQPLLCRLTGSKYPFIFVDEYQDTFPAVVRILLDRIRANIPDVVVGFFGDKAQAIYEDVVGELSPAHLATLERIPKEENYRCPTTVIELLNRFRTDIQQYPAGNNVEGAAVYVGCQRGSEDTPEAGYNSATGRLVDPLPFAQTRVLYLTHRLIARKAGYGDLFDAYSTHGGFMFEKFKSGEDPICLFLAFEVDSMADAWATGDSGTALTILRRNDFILERCAQKQVVTAAIQRLVSLIDEGGTVADVLNHMQQTGLVALIEALRDGLALAQQRESDIEENDRRAWTFFQSLGRVPAMQLRQYRRVIENHMPFVTKHGVKGDEFDTVVVVLDDLGANWNRYSFGRLLDGSETNDARRNRTTNLFYVCCSRARRNLVVVDFGYAPERRTRINQLFGPANVIVP